MSELKRAAAAGGKRLTVFGIIALVLGVLAMLAPAMTGLSIALVLGLLVTSAGVLRMIWAFQAGSLGKGLLMFALGSLTLLSGLVLFANPILGSAVMAIILAGYFIVDGVFEIAAGFSSRGGMWLIGGGAVSILLGVMIWAQYPLSGAWAMGTLLGIKPFFVGLIMINGGAAVRAFATS